MRESRGVHGWRSNAWKVRAEKSLGTTDLKEQGSAFSDDLAVECQLMCCFALKCGWSSPSIDFTCLSTEKPWKLQPGAQQTVVLLPWAWQRTNRSLFQYVEVERQFVTCNWQTLWVGGLGGANTQNCSDCMNLMDFSAHLLRERLWEDFKGRKETVV